VAASEASHRTTQTILDPDEIWQTPGLKPPGKSKKAAPRLKYLARWVIGDRTEPILAVFEWSQYGYAFGISGFQTSRLTYLEEQRVGTCVYRRP
jgi:hypothetical protein